MNRVLAESELYVNTTKIVWLEWNGIWVWKVMTAMGTGELTGLSHSTIFWYLMRDNAAGRWLCPCESVFRILPTPPATF